MACEMPLEVVLAEDTFGKLRQDGVENSGLDLRLELLRLISRDERRPGPSRPVLHKSRELHSDSADAAEVLVKEELHGPAGGTNCVKKGFCRFEHKQAQA